MLALLALLALLARPGGYALLGLTPECGRFTTFMTSSVGDPTMSRIIPTFIKQLERSPSTKPGEFGRHDERELGTYDHANQTDLMKLLVLTARASRGVEARNAVRPQDTPGGASISRLLLMKDVEKIAEAERCDVIGAIEWVQPPFVDFLLVELAKRGIVGLH